MVLRYLNILLCLLWCLNLSAIDSPNTADTHPFEIEQNDPTEVPATFSLIAEDSAIEGSAPFWVALELKLQKGWHSYWKNPGDSGMPLRIEWTLPEGFTVTKLHWPCPEKFEQEGLIGYGYDDSAIFLVEITPKNKITTPNIDIKADVRWLACSNMQCLPGEDSIALQLSVGPQKANIKQAPLFQRAREALPTAANVMQAQKNNGFIELELKLTGSNNVTSVQFFPEHKKIIDDKEETLVKAIDEGSFHLLLKEHKNIQAGQLKGIAIIHAKEPPYRRAIEIDLPIQTGADSALLAVATPPITTKSIIIDDESDQPAFEGGIGMALLFAFLGGAILNLMPCVLPVISFKVLSFVKMAGDSRLKTFKHGLAFSFGVIASFWCLAGLMLVLQSYGQMVGWGFQLREPIFIAFLAALLFLVALNLFGIFEFGLSVTSMAGNLEQGSNEKFSGFLASFCSGVLATALATPCTGPFLGSAVGFAVTLPAPQALLIFTTLGLGMAAPYLLLAGFPQLLRFLPKPGPWMVTFKELMGFVMLATVLWLVWVFSAQTNSLATVLMLVAFFLLSIAAWIFGRYCTPVSSKTSRLFSALLCLAFISAAGYTLVGASSPAIADMASDTPPIQQESSETAWNSFSPKKMQTFHESKRPIFIDFTAKWCLICQANHLVLSTAEVQAKLAEKNVITVKADWTRSDPEITKFLRRYGRNGVPLYLLYTGTPGERPEILPQVLTPEIVIEALNKL